MLRELLEVSSDLHLIVKKIFLVIFEKQEGATQKGPSFDCAETHHEMQLGKYLYGKRYSRNDVISKNTATLSVQSVNLHVFSVFPQFNRFFNLQVFGNDSLRLKFTQTFIVLLFFLSKA